MTDTRTVCAVLLPLVLALAALLVWRDRRRGPHDDAGGYG